MNKAERIQKAKEDQEAFVKSERARMERFCSQDFRAIGKPGSRWAVARQAAFDERLKNMTMAELTTEYNRRDGDHVKDHGCMPEDKEE